MLAFINYATPHLHNSIAFVIAPRVVCCKITLMKSAVEKYSGHLLSNYSFWSLRKLFEPRGDSSFCQIAFVEKFKISTKAAQITIYTQQSEMTLKMIGFLTWIIRERSHLGKMSKLQTLEHKKEFNFSPKYSLQTDTLDHPSYWWAVTTGDVVTAATSALNKWSDRPCAKRNIKHARTTYCI